MFVFIVAVVSIVIWSAVSRELGSSSKEKYKRKIVTLMSAGTLSTIILTFSLLKNIQL